jgi:hypothetical protein
MDRVNEALLRVCDGCGDALARDGTVEVAVATPRGVKLARTHVGCEQPAVEALIFENGGGRRVGANRGRRTA